MNKKVFSIIITSLLIIQCLLLPAKEVHAETSYIVDSNTTVWKNACEYYVRQDVTIDARVVTEGKTKLIIEPGKTLTVTKGIYVKTGSELMIDGSGTLNATGYNGNAAIGANANGRGGRLRINTRGGTATVNATSTSDAAGIGNGKGRDAYMYEVHIGGGTVKANGAGSASGIGWGVDNDLITLVDITGGKVTANGGNNGGSGIGGAPIKISGGDVTAKAGNEGAGIGPAKGYSFNLKLEISGGTVHAYGNNGGAGIGTGFNTQTTNLGSITISGGEVHAYGDRGSSGIGSGSGADMSTTVTISGGTVTAIGKAGGAGIGAGYWGNATDGNVKISGGDVTVRASGKAAGIGGGEESDFWSGYVGGEGATVNITGGLVKVVTEHTAIGHGGTDSVMGTLTIADDMAVAAGHEEERYERGGQPFNEAERVSACQYREVALIFKCGHVRRDATYTNITDATHTLDCPYCKKILTEGHYLLPVDGTFKRESCIEKGKNADYECQYCH